MVHQLNEKAELERHITGRMYVNTAATPYDPDKILNRDTFFFEHAKQEAFTVMDCFSHAVNGGFRYPIFVDRKQVFQMVLQTSKKSKEHLAKQKMLKGYAPG
jgi:hypothetical protein